MCLRLDFQWKLFLNFKDAPQPLVERMPGNSMCRNEAAGQSNSKI